MKYTPLAVFQVDLVTHINIYYFEIIFNYRLSQDIDSSSLVCQQNLKTQ